MNDARKRRRRRKRREKERRQEREREEQRERLDRTTGTWRRPVDHFWMALGNWGCALCALIIAICRQEVEVKFMAGGACFGLLVAGFFAAAGKGPHRLTLAEYVVASVLAGLALLGFLLEWPGPFGGWGSLFGILALVMFTGGKAHMGKPSRARDYSD